uniref:glutathione peroxidase 7 isoform X2 n=1 Tax=Pristiophorus japonicus TaxID=55135 RepID=UPI00398F3F3E
MLLVVATVLLLLVLPSEEKAKDFYSFKGVNIRGKLISLEKYRGSVSLVVNVASECGFTESHYQDLQQLQRELGSMHFNVLGFPCNQFGNQEPGSDQEIERLLWDGTKLEFLEVSCGCEWRGGGCLGTFCLSHTNKAANCITGATAHCETKRRIVT